MLLFDIDGTLIYSGGAGTRSIDKAFLKKYGLKDAMKGISPDGKTDLEEGAKIKLKPSFLLKYFKFGGYASDSWERSEILKKAYEKGKKIAERENFKISDIYVIGDTPKDIEAARKVSFKSIGMAVFHFSKEELLNAGADFVFESFKELKNFFEKLI